MRGDEDCDAETVSDPLHERHTSSKGQSEWFLWRAFAAVDRALDTWLLPELLPASEEMLNATLDVSGVTPTLLSRTLAQLFV